MKGFLYAVFAAIVACTIGVPPVLRFAVDKEVRLDPQSLVDFYLRPFIPTAYSIDKRTNTDASVKLTSYQFKNCASPSNEQFVLSSLTLGPDPLSFPGPLTVAFNGQIKDTVDAPLKASVYLRKKVGDTWIKIPCIGNIGSCTYDDLCSFLDSVTCPGSFVSAGIPCKCPFKGGSYTLPTASFDVETALFPAGDYRGQANLTVNNDLITCIELNVTFE